MTVTAAELTRKRCRPCEGGIPALSTEEIRKHLAAVPAWKLTEDGKRIRREWRVKDFTTALDFFQRLGSVAEAEDHHPDLTVTYNRCAVKFNTHSVNGGKGGLSENDFICAAKVNAVYAQVYA